MSVMSWFQALSPQAQAALIGGAFSLGGGIASGIGDEGKLNAQIAGNQSISRMNNATQLYNGDTDRLAAAGRMMGSGPLDFARQRAGMSMLGSMLGATGMGSPQQVFAPPNISAYQGKVGSGGIPGFNTSAAAKFFTPEAMAGAEAPYWQAVSALNPDINPNLAAAGYGDAAKQATGLIDQSRGANANRLNNTSQAVWGALGMGSPSNVMPMTAGGAPVSNYQGGSAGNPALGGGYQFDPNTGRPVPPDGYEYDSKTGQLKKKGGGFWHKLAQIGLIAGGGIATAMTGGAASPLLAAAIGAGTGAASGALNGGGWKGALTGAATGGLTGGLGAELGGAAGGAAGAAKQGFGQAVRSTLTSPRYLTQMAGAGVGGGVGNAMQIGSAFLPGSFNGFKPNGGNPYNIDQAEANTAKQLGPAGLRAAGIGGAGATSGNAIMQLLNQMLLAKTGGAQFPGGGIGGGLGRYPMDEKLPGQSSGGFYQDPAQARNALLMQLIMPIFQQLQQRQQRRAMTPMIGALAQAGVGGM